MPDTRGTWEYTIAGTRAGSMSELSAGNSPSDQGCLCTDSSQDSENAQTYMKYPIYMVLLSCFCHDEVLSVVHYIFQSQHWNLGKVTLDIVHSKLTRSHCVIVGEKKTYPKCIVDCIIATKLWPVVVFTHGWVRVHSAEIHHIGRFFKLIVC